jgi:hypothetical protein
MEAVSRRGDPALRQVVLAISFVLRPCRGDDERAGPLGGSQLRLALGPRLRTGDQ